MLVLAPIKGWGMQRSVCTGRASTHACAMLMLMRACCAPFPGSSYGAVRASAWSDPHAHARAAAGWTCMYPALVLLHGAACYGWMRTAAGTQGVFWELVLLGWFSFILQSCKTSFLHSHRPPRRSLKTYKRYIYDHAWALIALVLQPRSA